MTAGYDRRCVRHFSAQLSGSDQVLPALYERVLIPVAVLHELENAGTPAIVRTWLGQLPHWIATREVGLHSDPQLDELDPGERHAIQLASDEKADLLLTDERAGVRWARERGLLVTGTLGVLLQGAERGLVDLSNVLRDLQITAFRCTPGLIEEVKRSCPAVSFRSSREATTKSSYSTQTHAHAKLKSWHSNA